MSRRKDILGNATAQLILQLKANSGPNWHLWRSQEDCRWNQGGKDLAVATVPGLKKKKTGKAKLKIVAVLPNISERNVFQKTPLKWWYLWLFIVFSIMTAYFILIQTHLSSFPVSFEALHGLAQVHQSEQPHVICAVFLTADSYHSQHTLQLSSDRISPLVFDKLKAVLARHSTSMCRTSLIFPTHTRNVAFRISVKKLSRSTCSQRKKLYLPIINQ